MSPAIWFWLIYVLSLLFGLWAEYRPNAPYPYPLGLRYVLLYILIWILGFVVFGGPVKT
jgi:hypothetical protein